MSMAELHKHLSDTAIKLSVYSSILDFGLAMSVAFLQKNGGPFASLVNIFTIAITYITLLIVALFVAAFALKYRQNVVNIYTAVLAGQAKPKTFSKVKIYAEPSIPSQEDDRKAVMRVPSDLRVNDLAVQHVVNSRNESFVKFNGVWYKSDKNKFEKVARPDYE